MCYVAPRSTWLLTMLLTTRLSAGGGLSRKQRSRQKAEEQASQQARNRNKEARSNGARARAPTGARDRSRALAGREAETREVLSKVRPACPVKFIRHDTTYDISGKRERHDSVAPSDESERGAQAWR